MPYNCVTQNFHGPDAGYAKGKIQILQGHDLTSQFSHRLLKRKHINPRRINNCPIYIKNQMCVCFHLILRNPNFSSIKAAFRSLSLYVSLFPAAEGATLRSI